jgi:hypothetical protein
MKLHERVFHSFRSGRTAIGIRRAAAGEWSWVQEGQRKLYLVRRIGFSQTHFTGTEKMHVKAGTGSQRYRLSLSTSLLNYLAGLLENHRFRAALLIQTPLVKCFCSGRVPQLLETDPLEAVEPLSDSKVCRSKMLPKWHFWTIFAKIDTTQHPLLKRNSFTIKGNC